MNALCSIVSLMSLAVSTSESIARSVANSVSRKSTDNKPTCANTSVGTAFACAVRTSPAHHGRVKVPGTKNTIMVPTSVRTVSKRLSRSVKWSLSMKTAPPSRRSS